MLVRMDTNKRYKSTVTRSRIKRGRAMTWDSIAKTIAIGRDLGNCSSFGGCQSQLKEFPGNGRWWWWHTRKGLMPVPGSLNVLWSRNDLEFIRSISNNLDPPELTILFHPPKWYESWAIYTNWIGRPSLSPLAFSAFISSCQLQQTVISRLFFIQVGFARYLSLSCDSAQKREEGSFVFAGPRRRGFYMTGRRKARV